MKIRTITCFYNPALPDSHKTLDRFSRLLDKARSRFAALGFEVQSFRVATIPFPYLVDPLTLDHAVDYVVPLEQSLIARGFQYVSLGPALPEFPDSYAIIPALLKATQGAFFSGVIGSQQQVFLKSIRAAGQIIAEAAQITPDGFTNLRFTASANVKPYCPFFPAGYHSGDQPAFSLALESADLAINAFSKADSLENARTMLLKSIYQHAARLKAVTSELASEFNIPCQGFDFSLAPYPLDTCSLGGAIEKLGISRIGQMGSLGAAAFVASTLDQGEWDKAGFNGLMLPLLEDSVLAQRSIDGTLTIKDLLLYSAVCGTGLDTVPIPGDVSAGQISAILLDVAALSARLAKPLTARLMPVPGKKAGDLTAYDFEYFKNGRILDVPAAPLGGFLQYDDVMEIKPRNR
ncbi:MAG: DUF711 family protein [Chloroflexi bacterium]|nr:DUF711 family protein [Chloroflexota bacterium]